MMLFVTSSCTKYFCFTDQFTFRIVLFMLISNINSQWFNSKIIIMNDMIKVTLLVLTASRFCMLQRSSKLHQDQNMMGNIYTALLKKLASLETGN